MKTLIRARIDTATGRLSLAVDPRARRVRVNRRSRLMDGDALVLLTVLAAVHPLAAERDDLIAHVIGHRGHRDPAASLRQIIHRARRAIRPLGAEIVNIPHPHLKGVAGQYRLGAREAA